MQLAKLKAQNAEQDTETLTEVPTEVIEEVEIEAGEVAKVEVEAGEPTAETEGTVPEAEAWMVADEPESEGSDQVPLKAHIAMKTKLKGRVSERDAELEALKTENEALKNQGQQVAQPQSTVTAVPLEGDFNNIADYQSAMQKWVTSSNQAENQTAQRSQAQSQAARQLEESVDSHYQRAAELASKSSIAPETYQKADMQVRQAVDAVLPGRGDLVTDQMIARLGNGSEKVFYHIGINKVAQAKFQQALLSDQSGITAAMYLGELKTSLTAPASKLSKAPKPAAKVQGDESGTKTGDAKKLHEKYDAAHKRGSIQAAYNAKKEAKAAGVDVTTW